MSSVTNVIHASPLFDPSSTTSCKVNKQFSGGVPMLAERASEQAAALQAMLLANYPLEKAIPQRMLSPNTGAGFWVVTSKAGNCRVVYYGPGEYVQPHYHDIEEKLILSLGGCYVWQSEDQGKSWTCFYRKEEEELFIPAGTWYSLIADHQGLVMHTLDSGSSTIWIEGITIQNLHRATSL